jgi:SAM-dependent methyltransferase
MAAPHYVIRGGLEGRERLRVLARVMWPATRAVLEPLVARDARCLDVGCGGGDVTVELARLACDGFAVGIDVDETKVALARGDALQSGVRNIEFRTANVLEPIPGEDRFDVVYARFILSHLPDPAALVTNLRTRLAPGGVMILEDVDSSGMFCHPPCDAYQRFVELYIAAVRHRGADPNIGPRLPGLLADEGLADVEMRVVQPVALTGEVKLLAPITFEAIADAVVDARLAGRDEIANLLDELWTYATTDGTLVSIPRVVQAWARNTG